jgi:hypothetical protein
VVCSVGKEKATGLKKMKFIKKLAESCVPGAINTATTSENDLKNMLEKKYNLSLQRIYSDPEGYYHTAKEKVNKIDKAEAEKLTAKEQKAKAAEAKKIAAAEKVAVKLAEKQKKSGKKVVKLKYKYYGTGINSSGDKRKIFKAKNKYWYYSPNQIWVQITPVSAHAWLKNYKDSLKQPKAEHKPEPKKVETKPEEPKAAKGYKYIGKGLKPSGKEVKLYEKAGKMFVYSNTTKQMESIPLAELNRLIERYNKKPEYEEVKEEVKEIKMPEPEPQTKEKYTFIGKGMNTWGSIFKIYSLNGDDYMWVETRRGNELIKGFEKISSLKSKNYQANYKEAMEIRRKNSMKTPEPVKEPEKPKEPEMDAEDKDTGEGLDMMKEMMKIIKGDK